MVPEIWSATDRILLSSWTIFCHFSPLTAWKIKTSKMKKKPGDIIILHKYTKNPYHWLYCSWDMVCYGCNCYFHFRLYFSLLLPPLQTALKMKISKQWKWLEISFYTIVPKIMIICYTVPETWCVSDVIVIFHFWAIFCFYPPDSPKNENLKKMKKIPGAIIILYNCNKNHDHMLYSSWHMLYSSWDMVCDKCNSYFSFWAIFCNFTPWQPEKWKAQKNEKIIWRYNHFTQLYQKSRSYPILFLRYGTWWM